MEVIDLVNPLPNPRSVPLAEHTIAVYCGPQNEQ
jgi:hypothetical protein